MLFNLFETIITCKPEFRKWVKEVEVATKRDLDFNHVDSIHPELVEGFAVLYCSMRIQIASG